MHFEPQISGHFDHTRCLQIDAGKEIMTVTKFMEIGSYSGFYAINILVEEL